MRVEGRIRRPPVLALAVAQLLGSRVTLCEVLNRAAVTRAYGLALARGGRRGRHIPRGPSPAALSCTRSPGHTRSVALFPSSPAGRKGVRLYEIVSREDAPRARTFQKAWGTTSVSQSSYG